MSEQTGLIPAKTETKLSKAELAGSKFFPSIDTPAKAAVVQQMAFDMGMSPVFVAANISWISGKPCMTGLLLAAALKKTSKYRYIVREKTDKVSRIEFFERVEGKWESVGVESFTIEEAEKAQLTKNPTWAKFRKQMLHWRCLVAGVRTHAPDVLSAGPTHTIEEMKPDGKYDEDGVPVIDAEYEIKLKPEDYVRLNKLIVETNTDVNKLLGYYGVERVQDLQREQVLDAESKLIIKLEAMKVK